jgi:general nucleoside transport system permease protein
LFGTVLLPALAVFTGLVIGAIVVIITDAAVMTGFRSFFHAPGAALAAAWRAVATAYGALFYGAVGSPKEIIQALGHYLATRDSAALLHAVYPLTESLVAATPYIFGGLAVALALHCNLFNIGAEGQIGIGALSAAFVGYSIKGLPLLVHLPLAILAGALGGAIWAGIPGYLKAKTGAHEVVNSIMMNWISFRLSDWLINGPMKAPGYRPVTRSIQSTAILPRFLPAPSRVNVGFLLALAAAALVYWFLFKTTIGFEVRTVGANPRAARYAGMNITRCFLIAMLLSGSLAGLAGASQVLGVNYWVGQGFSAGFWFDSIAIALLGNSQPAGVVLAALLFGALRNGATRMQSLAGIPIDIISIIQALVIVFVAAPAIIRGIYHIRERRAPKTASAAAGGGI